MAAAGANLIRCRNTADLDRVQAAGMCGVAPLPLAQGATDKLRAQVEKLAAHPALALWEGPDEVVWNFTAYSGLHRKMDVHKRSGEWWDQTPNALAYSEKQADIIIPNMRAAAAMIRGVDTQNRPLWINEALKSDTCYVRRYLDFVDITGCDTYPVRKGEYNIASIGPATDRWLEVGRGKPVFMVLQAFSWHELGDYHGHKEAAYPTFAESRFMAYDAIARGASGIMYWGSHYLENDTFRLSLYALIAELAALQPFLTAPEVQSARLELVELGDGPHGVQMATRRAGDDWLVILVNEDEVRRMGVVVSGLDGLEGAPMHLLYGGQTRGILHGELIARMPPRTVQVWCTSRGYETPRRDGRDYAGEPG